MTEQNNNQTDELSDHDKAIAAEEERRARLWAKAQADEATKAETDRDWKGLHSMDSRAGRDFVRRQLGFDPGWPR
jgi:hypothetical protein